MTVCVSEWRPALRAAIFVACTALASCADIGATQNSSQFQSRLGLLANDLKSYKLGIGDKVRVVVYGEQDLSGQFDIGPQGNVALPLVGELPARGRSPLELKDAIVTRLSSGFLRNPRVTVEVVAYRPFYVHGEVRSAGEFTFKSGMRIRDAVAVAGGYSYRANQTYVLLTREGLPDEVRVALPTDVMVMPGDNIRVAERFF